MAISVERIGFDELRKKLSDMSDGFGRLRKMALEDITLYIHSKIPPYPPPPVGGTGFVSDKQRRWFFASLRDGTIEVPYKRKGSAGLGGSITTEVREIGKDVVGVVGTNKVYAPWVISEKKVGTRGPQARIHENRWYTLHEVFRRERDEVIRRLRQFVKNWMGT